MDYRLLRYPNGWEWHLLSQSRTESLLQRPPAASGARPAESAAEDALAGDPAAAGSTGGAAGTGPQAAGDGRRELLRRLPMCREWAAASGSRREDHIAVSELPGGESVLAGTIMLQLSDSQEDMQPLHYWLTGRQIVTMQDDLRFALRLQRKPWEDKLERSRSAPEAFAVMLASALETIHLGVDGFEQRLSELEAAMRERGRSDLLENIFSRRYDLLYWSRRYIAVKELADALREAFMDTVTEHEGYQRLSYKLERIGSLIDHYAGEIDTLISMDDALSAFRGNDIMKTLTIFTVLFTPATVAGTLWGMNFTRLPWAAEPWGFASICAGVVALTVCIYAWLWRKGWTGNILRGRRSARRKRGRDKQPAPTRVGRSSAVAEVRGQSAPAEHTLPSRRRRAAAAPVRAADDPELPTPSAPDTEGGGLSRRSARKTT